MGSLFVLLFQPLVEICLQLFDRFVELLTKRHSIKFIEKGLMKPLTDPVGLRTLGLGARVIDILQG